MKTGFESRLRTAIKGIEQSDGKLAEELRDIRSSGDRVRGEEGVGRQLEGRSRDVVALTRETIVLRTGRPVLAVVNDTAELEFRDADSEVWKQRLLDAREPLGKAIRAVGRVEVENHDLDWVGTGWLVGPDVMVTNRHVAEEFTRSEGRRFVFRQGFRGPMSARVDFLEEIGRAEAREFRLDKILHVEGDDGPDVAFFRVDQVDGTMLAEHIRLSERRPVRDQQVAVIGYPARDSRVPDQDLMLEIFGNVFDKKRLAPGQVKQLAGGLVHHDCSTLGGNSGSVVLDLASGEAVALHFSGRFLESNYAVPAQTVARLLRDLGRPVRPPSAPRPNETSAVPAMVPGRGGYSARITIPLEIDVVVRAPQMSSALPAAGVPGPATVGGVQFEVEDEVTEEGRPEDYADRKGYSANFLGPEVPMPQVLDDGDVLTFRFDGNKERELKYQHFTVLMSESRRMCWYSAVNIDGSRTDRATRTAWRPDPRIPRGQQIVNECYGNSPRFSRGHMTRREDPIWGNTAAARRGNSDSMHVTNAVPQMQPFNAGIWLGLEDYALKNCRRDDMKISVITGPVLDDEEDPLLFGVQIPVQFWKVIAFIHDETGELCTTGYTMSQEDFLSENEFVFGQHKSSQVSLSVIENMAGIDFGDELKRLDPLERVHESRPRPLQDFSQIRFR